MTCRYDPYLSKHTITKSENNLTLAVLLTCAHHGASLLIDAIDPCGTLDNRVYKKIGRIFDKEIPYEKYLKGDMLEDVAVYYSMTSKQNLSGQPFTNHTCAVNTVRTLIENNIPVGVISNDNLDSLNKYKMVFLSQPNNISGDNLDKFINYVEDGGTLYFSGGDEAKLLKILLKAECKGMTAENRTYIAPAHDYRKLFLDYNEKYPLPFDFMVPVIECDEAPAAFLTLPYTDPKEQKFASIHSNPPGRTTGIPSVIIKKYGKGNVIWSAAAIENETIEDYKKIIINFIKAFVNDYSYTTNAPRRTELIAFKDGNSFNISVVDLLCDIDPVEIPSFNISIKSKVAPEKVILLPEEKEIPFFFDGNDISLKTLPLKIFDMYSIICGL
jgi:hypothetical protein